MKDSDDQLAAHEVGEFVVPIVKLFTKIFHDRDTTLMSIDLIHITASVVTSIVASCIDGDTPTDDAKFKQVLRCVIELLMEVHDGTGKIEYNQRIS